MPNNTIVDTLFSHFWAEDKDVDRAIKAITRILNSLKASSQDKAFILEVIGMVAEITYARGGVDASEMIADKAANL
ncbi:hypothetical protein LCGC14_1645710, partial [marine sediment metagenome]